MRCWLLVFTGENLRVVNREDVDVDVDVDLRLKT